jgi:glycosyltransferase involved in cell wall biosynthesis
MLQNHLISNHPEVLNEIELTIVGDGPLASKVHEFLNSRIVMKWIWFITQDRNQVLAEMTSQDLLIQYPTTEGQPGVTLEALSVGLPIFTTPIDNCLQTLNCVIVSNIDDFYMDLIDVILGNVKIVLDLAAVRQHLYSHHSLDSMITKIMGDNCP